MRFSRPRNKKKLPKQGEVVRIAARESCQHNDDRRPLAGCLYPNAHLLLLSLFIDSMNVSRRLVGKGV
jgi:hypothetical protein